VTTPAERAVLEAVRMHDRKALEEGNLSPRLRRAALDYRAALAKNDNLNVSPQPDLAALDHAVAEAVEAYITRGGIPRPDLWKRIEDAYNARRAALKPKPRYEALQAPVCMTVIRNTLTGVHYTAEEVAALLNQKEVKP